MFVFEWHCFPVFLAMEEFGSKWETIRLVIAIIIGGGGVISVANITPGRQMHPDEQKALIWIFLVLSITAYIFMTAIIIICAVLALIFVTHKIGPLVSQWLYGASRDFAQEVAMWKGLRGNAPSLPGPVLDDLEAQVRNGTPHDTLLELIEYHRSNGNGNHRREG